MISALVSKSGKTGSIQAQAKAVKRKFRGLEPAGQIGLDYNEIEAKESHYKDGTAFAVGDRIYTFIKGRTKFNTFEVLCYLHNKHQVEDTRKKLRSYFGRKPTPEEIAEKMELKVDQIGKYLG